MRCPLFRTSRKANLKCLFSHVFYVVVFPSMFVHFDFGSFFFLTVYFQFYFILVLGILLSS